jgi:lysozyme
MPNNLLPKIRLAPPRDIFTENLLKHKIRDAVVLIGKRGWYAKNDNERGIYDDAIFFHSPSGVIIFNANTDPTCFGFNPSVGKGFASLKTGLWRYKIGQHRDIRPALVQAEPVTIRRDGGKEETGYFGINIHPGSYNSTSSEGCQTIWPDQWQAFIHLVVGELKRYEQTSVQYLLT